jgi:ubiquinone/menaquinone biosynthesis C-methylase UbiE
MEERLTKNRYFFDLPNAMELFVKFEHEGWQRVADKHDLVWARSTRQFIPPLLDAVEVTLNMSILDVGCGPGYVAAAAAERGATPRGLDFSGEMVAIAQRMFPRIEFCEGDAQNLPFTDATFDRVLANFALLRVSDLERACAEAFRVLKPGGKFGFTVWAASEENPARYPFDAEQDAGVRTAGLLARQASEKLGAIQRATEESVRRYAKGDSFFIPKAACVVAVTKT